MSLADTDLLAFRASEGAQLEIFCACSVSTLSHSFGVSAAFDGGRRVRFIRPKACFFFEEHLGTSVKVLLCLEISFLCGLYLTVAPSCCCFTFTPYGIDGWQSSERLTLRSKLFASVAPSFSDWHQVFQPKVSFQDKAQDPSKEVNCGGHGLDTFVREWAPSGYESVQASATQALRDGRICHPW